MIWQTSFFLRTTDLRSCLWKSSRRKTAEKDTLLAAGFLLKEPLGWRTMPLIAAKEFTDYPLLPGQDDEFSGGSVGADLGLIHVFGIGGRGGEGAGADGAEGVLER